MNDKPVLSPSEKEALKRLIEGKAPFLKELVSEDTLVNVSLRSADLEGNTSFLSFVCLLFVLLFICYSFCKVKANKSPRPTHNQIGEGDFKTNNKEFDNSYVGRRRLNIG